ncbi:MAG: AAA family ATPase [Candidatus Latescibacteria bacterium]|jgi:predicted ATPase|nr:AAA family ATPase [Candidatus Latescibacterota bacterium]MBT4137428.1 AAA family ATPase [Candidatus Latescibacterota bacterium]MBT5831504.1 AAA family ATPase [Candidatus Latescibacterota bacterium]
MIQRLETLYYQCLRHVDQDLSTSQVLVGPNGSGKTTFLDAIAFLSDLVCDGLDAAIYKRVNDVHDLFWLQKADRFELAIELAVPEVEGRLFGDHEYTRCRYEIAIGLVEDTDEVGILGEKVLLLTDSLRDEVSAQESLFPVDGPAPKTLGTPRVRGIKTIVNKVPGGNDKFYDETGSGWDPSFKLGARRSALANLPEDETRFPVATWLKRLLMDGVLCLNLDSEKLKRPCPPGFARALLANGANLPWVIATLKDKAPAAHSAWVNHLRSVLPNLESVNTVVRPEDRHCYLVARYQNGLEVPSWMLSDGTLRLFALTQLAYLPDFEGVCLIEEPETGLHPGAVETVFRSLSAVPHAQVLMTTHSPVILNVSEPNHLLCFSPSDTGATKIVLGETHETLNAWRTRTDLSALYAGGVLR